MDSLPSSFTFVDVETTGTNSNRDRIIEIAIIRVEDMKEVQTYHSLVNPQVYVPEFITGITGITASDVESAPTFDQIWRDVHELTHESLFVAHNARFDYGFLKNEFKRLERHFSADLLCTVQLLRRLHPQLRRFNLDAVIQHFQFDCPNRHRALDDCAVLWKLIQTLHTQFDQETLKTAIHKTLKTPTLPKQLFDDQLKDLPDGPGVYLFYGSNDALIYIGKSKNLRLRIRSHFASDYINSIDQKISEQINRIETIPTAGELEALILESNLIKERMPLLNHQLRYANELVIAKQKENPLGYWEIDLETVNQIDSTNLEQIIGVYKSKKQAKQTFQDLMVEYQLCPKLLGLENGKGACFQSQLGKCHGACLGKELPIKYNIRFLQAFSQSKIKSWPFKGPVVINEASDSKQTSHVIYNWCYVGQLSDGEDIPLIESGLFDYDIYKILVKWILESKSSINELQVKKLNSNP